MTKTKSKNLEDLAAKALKGDIQERFLYEMKNFSLPHIDTFHRLMNENEIDWRLKILTDAGFKPTVETVQKAVDYAVLDAVEPVRYFILKGRYRVSTSATPEQIQETYNHVLRRDGIKAIRERLWPLMKLVYVKPSISQLQMRKLEEKAARKGQFHYLLDLQDFLGGDYVLPYKKIQERIVTDLKKGNTESLEYSVAVLNFRPQESQILKAFGEYMQRYVAELNQEDARKKWSHSTLINTLSGNRLPLMAAEYHMIK